MTIDARNKTVILETCHDTALLDRWVAELENAYTKPELTLILESVANAFPGYGFRLSSQMWQLRIDRLLVSATRKSELAEMAAQIFASPDNRELVRATFTPAQESLWQMIYTQVYASLADAEKLVEKPLVSHRSSYYYTGRAEKPVPEMAWLKLRTIGWRSIQRLELPDFFFKAFSEIFSPALPLRETGGEEAVYNAELQMISVLPVLRTIYMTGGLDRGRFRLQATAVNKLDRQLMLPRFPAQEKDLMTVRLSTWLAANAYALHAVSDNIRLNSSPAPENEMRDIVSAFQSEPSMIFPVVASFLDKATQTVMENTSFRRIYHTVCDFITSTPAGEWMDADDLIRAVYAMPDVTSTFAILNEKAMGESYVSNQRDGALIRYSNVYLYLTIPCILGTAALFASLGLIEAVLTPARELDPSPVWGLRRFRLTPLGAYAFRLTSGYTRPAIEERVWFEFDKDRLMVRALGDSNPYEGLIAAYLSPVGARRYVATPEMMMKTCGDARSLRERISEFKALAGKDLPAVWEEFLSGLTDNCGKLREADDMYDIFDVDPDDRGLQRLITTDPELKRLSLRAENYKVLVRSQDLNAFRQRLRQLGYLV